MLIFKSKVVIIYGIEKGDNDEIKKAYDFQGAARQYCRGAGAGTGDRLVSVNGQPVEDVFDYRYLMNEELVVLLVEKPDGEEWELEVEKEYEEDLGIEFENGG